MDRQLQAEPAPASAEGSNGISLVQVTQDGLVTKQVLRPGHGETPPLHARCLGETITLSCSLSALSVRFQLSNLSAPAVHFTSKLASGDGVLVNTREESASGQPFRVVAGRGAAAPLHFWPHWHGC